jgi:hypothetical protein
MPNQYTDNPVPRVCRTCEYCGESFDAYPSDVARGNGRWCSRACFLSSRNNPTPEMIAQRFWAKVDKNGPIPPHRPELGPCWLWMASRNSNGYGQFGVRVNGKRRPVAASRVAWELTYGPLGEGMFACHKCDNPLCVNPAHLFEGDAKANTRDMMAKGRLRIGTRATGDDHWMRHRPERIARGERNGNAKANAALVREIRARYAADYPSIGALARCYGLSKSAVDGIIKGRTWRDV